MLFFDEQPQLVSGLGVAIQVQLTREHFVHSSRQRRRFPGPQHRRLQIVFPSKPSSRRSVRAHKRLDLFHRDKPIGTSGLHPFQVISQRVGQTVIDRLQPFVVVIKTSAIDRAQSHRDRARLAAPSQARSLPGRHRHFVEHVAERITDMQRLFDDTRIVRQRRQHFRLCVKDGSAGVAFQRGHSAALSAPVPFRLALAALAATSRDGKSTYRFITSSTASAPRIWSGARSFCHSFCPDRRSLRKPTAPKAAASERCADVIAIDCQGLDERACDDCATWEADFT